VPEKENKMAQRRQHGADIKAKVALAAIKGERTANEIAKLYGVHPVMVTKWKKQALEELPGVFANRRSAAVRAQEDITGSLYQEIGRLKVELDWLKKKAASWQ
jgi:transposase-like protein